MLFLLFLFGIIALALGIAFLTDPKLFKQYLALWKKGKNMYIAVVLKIFIGLIFIFSSFDPKCQLKGFILVMGILGLAGGIVALILGMEKMKDILKWWDKKSPSAQRFLAIIHICLGVLIIYAA